MAEIQQNEFLKVHITNAAKYNADLKAEIDAQGAIAFVDTTPTADDNRKFLYAQGKEWGKGLDVNESASITGVTSATQIKLEVKSGKIQIATYTPILINSITSDKSFEIDDATSSVALEATLSKPGKAEGTSWSNTNNLAVSGSTVTATAPITTNTNTSFVLVAAETDGNATATKTVNVRFNKYAIVFGTSTAESISGESDLTGASNVVSTSKAVANKTVTPAATGAYIYVLVPQTFGTPTFYIANSGGDRAALAGGFKKLSATTTKYSTNVVYDIYRSVDLQNAAQRVDLV